LGLINLIHVQINNYQRFAHPYGVLRKNVDC
jgi:hypothetical protein